MIIWKEFPIYIYITRIENDSFLQEEITEVSELFRKKLKL